MITLKIMKIQENTKKKTPMTYISEKRYMFKVYKGFLWKNKEQMSNNKVAKEAFHEWLLNIWKEVQLHYQSRTWKLKP